MQETYSIEDLVIKKFGKNFFPEIQVGNALFEHG